MNHVLVFAGTGEGPSIARALLESGHRVSVSVVSTAASRAYAGMLLNELHVGAFPSQGSLSDYLAAVGVTQVVDATHPFALTISAELRSVCSLQNLPLIRFERPDHAVDEGSLLARVEDLAGCALSGHRLLLAVGARQLAAAAHVGGSLSVLAPAHHGGGPRAHVGEQEAARCERPARFAGVLPCS